MAKLSEKQLLFVQEYLIDRNATEAAKRAGYSEKTAHSQGPRLLEHVGIKEEISKHNAKRQERTQITQDLVIQEIANVAFARLGLVCDWDVEGKLTLKPMDSICESGMAGIKAIQSTDSYDKDGNVIATKNNIVMHDKLKALEVLCKHLGILDGSGKEKGNPGASTSRILQALSNLGKGSGKG